MGRRVGGERKGWDELASSNKVLLVGRYRGGGRGRVEAVGSMNRIGLWGISFKGESHTGTPGTACVTGV